MKLIDVELPIVLVIDDDLAVERLVSHHLRSQYEVKYSATGANGVVLALQHLPVAILLDVQMGGWDGFDTLASLRQHRVLDAIPALMLTSDTSRETVLAAIRAGADDYLVKSTLTSADLLARIEKAIARRAGQTRPPTRSTHSHHEAHAVPPAPAEASDRHLQVILDQWD